MEVEAEAGTDGHIFQVGPCWGRSSEEGAKKLQKPKKGGL